MTNRIIAVIISVLLGCVAGCATGAVGGKPQGPLSNHERTSRIFTTPAGQIDMAISNAFADFQYRGMVLERASENLDILPDSRSVDGFVLRTIHEPIAKVSLDRGGTTWVPYIAYFNIATTPISDSQTKVTIYTFFSEVIDGQETFNFHGGTANHYRTVPPVRQEEESVLSAISNQLPPYK